MSTQLEFIMQLYMMNLLQQQQQQQQQQQMQQHLLQQSPTKEIDITSSSSNTVHTTTTTPSAPLQREHNEHRTKHRKPKPKPQQQQQSEQQPRTRTQRRKNSQKINCSSSSSSSPNSNSSPTSATHVPHFQQMLLNNLSPLTQLLAQTQTAPPAHLLLTPPTPTSLGQCSVRAAAAALAASTTASPAAATSSLPADYTSSTLYSLQAASSALLANPFTASNFLQSSTVTSTPTPTAKTPAATAQDLRASMDRFVVDGEEEVEGEEEEVEEEECVVAAKARDLRRVSASRYQSTAPTTSVDDEDDHVDDDEDEKPLSSLFSSSGGVSTSAGSMDNASKLLICSGVQALESTSDSFDDSAHMPYTPVKQPADSSFSTQSPLSLYKQTDTATTTISSSAVLHGPCINDEASNMTPLALGNALLTPPSSEQLLGTNNFDSSQTTLSTGVVAATTGSLTTASSLDAFLQNEENLKNLKKFSSYLECENPLCRQENLREHFHCFDEPCQGKILSKKDDIIRHLKWHKKRKESLLLGFARFSAADDCAPSYGAGCAYNWKQTHYHCVYEDCPKVYVSTSDVQMHANFHRKNSEIVQEGFRRFRAHENCKIEECPFYGKKTSHYHCCREGCNHTFKNKADMDKHKTYHLKDYQLTQDGFKKILKTEACPFDACKFSTVCNHIHCVRENCNYILHSSSQMISHKRKHDRQDGEQAYQSFKKEKGSSEEESPTPAPISTNVSTPLSSLSAEHFLARKRGRPPKKIQLPSEVRDAKRIKQEANDGQVNTSGSAAIANPALAGIYPPFLPNFNPAAAAAAQSMQSQDPNAPNFQLTHLMALFQLQNPLFYQNLYPGGMAANMANMLGAAAAAAGLMPQAPPMLSNLAAFGSATGATGGSSIKSEFGEKQQFKE